MFSTAGDSFAAAFARAGDALGAAVDAQAALTAEGWPDGAVVRVRLGLHSGEASERDGDYFGPVLNQAARVMAAAHGGQILLSAVTAGLVDGADLVDLGVHRLRDLTGVEHLFQVRAEGLRAGFPPPVTLDAVPGNLPVDTSTFVGRVGEVEQLAALVSTHRLVTLTGVGGVGKTRLARKVAADLAGQFPDGVWLVELATIGDPAAVPDLVATVLGITPGAGRSPTERIVEALSGRRLLVVRDNCEHVLDAAADLVEAVLAGTKGARIVATSREGLRVGAEQLWTVPSLRVDGPASEAIELFVERARAVRVGFSIANRTDLEAVSVICRRLDGIALAIELAAARMVAMTPQDVQDRLDDRFRLLAGGRRGVERHQTLRHAVAWSYDLLDDDERLVLCRCAVFAGGFDLPAATHLCDPLDEYTVLDMLDSLVRKSLVTVEQFRGTPATGCWKRSASLRRNSSPPPAPSPRSGTATPGTSPPRPSPTGTSGTGPTCGWRWTGWTSSSPTSAGFRWAADHHDLVTAVAIAAHTTMLAGFLQRLESIGWAEELLDAATDAQVRQLPRLYTAASNCVYTGSADVGVGYAQTAVALEADPAYQGFGPAVSRMAEIVADAYTGRIDRALEICADLAGQHGLARVLGLTLSVWWLPTVGRTAEARLMADDGWLLLDKVDDRHDRRRLCQLYAGSSMTGRR